jgi:hypothetical protein
MVSLLQIYCAEMGCTTYFVEQLLYHWQSNMLRSAIQHAGRTTGGLVATTPFLVGSRSHAWGSAGLVCWRQVGHQGGGPCGGGHRYTHSGPPRLPAEPHVVWGVHRCARAMAAKPGRAPGVGVPLQTCRRVLRFLSTLMYSDDIAMLSVHPSELQQLIDNLVSVCTCTGLTISLVKTKVMQFLPRRGSERHVPIHIFSLGLATLDNVD